MSRVSRHASISRCMRTSSPRSARSPISRLYLAYISPISPLHLLVQVGLPLRLAPLPRAARGLRPRTDACGGSAGRVRVGDRWRGRGRARGRGTVGVGVRVRAGLGLGLG